MKILSILIFLTGCGINMEADVYEPRKKKEEYKEQGRLEEANTRNYSHVIPEYGSCTSAYESGGNRDTVCIPERYTYQHTKWMVNAGRLEAYYWNGYSWVYYWVYSETSY
jgi:hypothetical protein